jgi:hypothetical protein
MDREPWGPPRPPLDPRNWRLHTRSDPVENQVGIGRKRPLLTLIGVWLLGIAVIVGLAYVLPRRAEGVVALLIMFGLLTTVRL